MSLINDALKKAQRERSGETPPATPPEKPPGKIAPPAPPPSAPAASSSGSSGFKGMPLIIALVVVVAGLLTWRAMGPSKDVTPVEHAIAETQSPAPIAVTTERRAADSQPIAASVPPPVVELTPTPPPAAVVAAKPEPAAQLPAVSPELPQQAIIVNIPSATTERQTQTSMLPAMVITIPDTPVGTSPAAPLVSVRQQDPRILAYLDALRVNGIRPSPDDPKVLANNRVYRINDVVDRELNLRLTAIAPSRLTFEDERGMPYVKNF